MTKAKRPGKVFLDWSQNTGSKTTISPYSLRGTADAVRRRAAHLGRGRGGRGGAAARWCQLRFDEVLARVDEHGDLFGDLLG